MEIGQIATSILNYSCIYWFIAFAMSVFWGYFGVMYERNREVTEETTKEVDGKHVTVTRTKVEIKKNLCWYELGTFLSDGMLSLVGWFSLYLLLINLQEPAEKFDNFNIFLGTVAVICITGYGYKIAEKLK
jgi:hypothetical protein